MMMLESVMKSMVVGQMRWTGVGSKFQSRGAELSYRKHDLGDFAQSGNVCSAFTSVLNLN